MGSIKGCTHYMESAVAEHFADRLLAQIAAKGSPVCVGIDPVFEQLPQELRTGDSVDERLAAMAEFCSNVLRIVAPIVPAVKPQIAYFEVYRDRGVQLYFDVIRQARALGLVVIGDCKRGDIGSTARAYATGLLGGPDAMDAVTVNGYFGADGTSPFIELAQELGKGLFVLVRTSNPSAADIQDFADATGKRFYEHMAEQVAAMGSADSMIGSCGYSCVGAVVGATYPAEARRLRELMDKQLFLVPGYGAQGASADDCAAAFKPDGTGAIVNASRSVLYAHTRKEYAGLPWQAAVEHAAQAFAADIAQAVMK